ncbi:MAG: glycosyltransferase [Clostridia bacterium]|nr:glycosyltransferase [Clostridia bacterium]
MNAPLVSIIIPMYNSQDKINKCINSVVKQTYKKIEILLVNDGSTDNSLSICNDIAKADNRIKIIDIENQGVSVARNIGIQQAKGDYIMFVDSDDYVENTIVEKLLNNLIENDADISQCGCNVANNNGKILKTYNVPYYNILNREEIIKKIVLPLFGKIKVDSVAIQGFCVCKLFKKDIINNIRFNVEQRIYQDRCFNIDAYLNAQKTSFIDEQLYYYVVNSTSSTQRKRDDIWKQCTILIDALNSRIGLLSGDFNSELKSRIHKTASTRLVYVTRHIFKYQSEKGILNAVRFVKQMRQNFMFDKGVLNPDLGFVFSVLSKLLHYRLYFLAVLVSKIAG